MSKSIHYLDAIKNGSVLDKGTHYETIDGSMIFWHGAESAKAQYELRNASKKTARLVKESDISSASSHQLRTDNATLRNELQKLQLEKEMLVSALEIVVDCERNGYPPDERQFSTIRNALAQCSKPSKSNE